ncbi:C-terminal helicase domain-containing protein [Sporomusa sp.]|uniref:DEAD/DEAH box helicase n=1 Tax=Sporomusa sp. TaxID=2078658 RepID=UPI002C1168B2|nr:C-terminal helicase domain-containing protein [Sporomusa sp.]HWR45812.1 C-terminal helicase domain-containing protein [Sporomusa sp.]
MQETLGQPALFLHGSLPKTARDRMVAVFQEDDQAPPFFILSLKAGGVGLNLTRADTVFHYDRWWNPAVENQATDRAFRIGQTQNVQVYKLIATATLEEKIDEMIEDKKQLADTIVGGSEAWLSELPSAELKAILQLKSNTWEG